MQTAVTNWQVNQRFHEKTVLNFVQCCACLFCLLFWTGYTSSKAAIFDKNRTRRSGPQMLVGSCALHSLPYDTETVLLYVSAARVCRDHSRLAAGKTWWADTTAGPCGSRQETTIDVRPTHAPNRRSRKWTTSRQPVCASAARTAGGWKRPISRWRGNHRSAGLPTLPACETRTRRTMASRRPARS